MIIITQSKARLPLPKLLRLVLKYIYDYKNVSYSQAQDMKSSMVAWHNWVSEQKQKVLDKYGLTESHYMPVGTKGTIADEIEFQLMGMAWLLHADETGKLDARKRLFAEHKIDYRKFYKLQEAYTENDFKKARAALELNMKLNPEDYK